jgi:hypothetical protein
MMTGAKLKKLRAALLQIRKNPIGHMSRELQGLAKKLGREEFNRGKEPTWVRKIQPELSPPLSIPNHSAPLSPGVCRSVANALLDDCDEWDQYLQAHKDES